MATDPSRGALWTRRSLLVLGVVGTCGLAEASLHGGGWASAGEVVRSGPGPEGELDGPPPMPRVLRTRTINRLIGPRETAKHWHVYGADLGNMFWHQGRIHMLFGDTFGPSKTFPFLANHAPNDWRSNTHATVAPVERPNDGLELDWFATDRPGHAKELLYSAKNFVTETTVIPTYGISLGDRIALHCMSVRQWLPGQRASVNYSGFAYSEDNGETWIAIPQARWPSNNPFAQVAMVGIPPWVYLFGVHGGRRGAVRLARVRAENLFQIDAYEYWNGSGWHPELNAAVPIVPAPVGELSVQWNSHYRAWLMTHQNVFEGRLVLRTARHLTGPWSDPITLLTSHDYPGAYAPFLTPIWNDGPELFYTITRYGPYAVYLMHTTLSA